MEAVKRALIEYSKRCMEDWVNPTAKKTKFRGGTANSFLLGVMLDRSIPAEQAWDAANWINKVMGDDKDPKILWHNLVKVHQINLRGFLRYGFGGKAFHRHYNVFSKLLPKAAQHILDNYKGDPRRIWNGQRDVAGVRQRLENIPAIGSSLSRMAVLIWARNYGFLGGRAALRQLDIKPDVHVLRVFSRTTLISPFAKKEEAIAVARKLNPSFPARLDAPAWEIGRTWCHKTGPNCKECPLGDVCKKII